MSKNPVASLTTLPLALLDEIVEYLYLDEMLTLQQVSKTLKEYIEEHPAFINSMILCVDKFLQAPCRSTRSYKAIVANTRQLTDENLATLKSSLLTAGQSVKEIYLITPGMTDGNKVLLDLLEIFPGVEGFAVDICGWSWGDEYYIERSTTRAKCRIYFHDGLCFTINESPHIPQIERVGLSEGTNYGPSCDLEAFPNLKQLRYGSNVFGDCNNGHVLDLEDMRQLEELEIYRARLKVQLKFKRLKVSVVHNPYTDHI